MYTSKQIRIMKPAGKMTKTSGDNGILFDNGVKFISATSREQSILWRKLSRMGYIQHYNFNSDENDGIVQAGLNGENPFAFSMICADPRKNGIYK